ncbi:MAG: cobalamin B12-binding domain-containing protein [Candidatus Cryosericum sp.]
MIAQHERIAALSQEAHPSVPSSTEEPWSTVERQFLAALVTGDSSRALDIARNAVHSGDDIARFYLDVVQPAMYDIGQMWERNQVSVAMEHFATSIVARIMSALYMRVPAPVHEKGSALVTSAPNEFHELGARMVADLLELDGWNVTFLGANTPVGDLIALAKILNPQIVAISVAMPFNIDVVQRTVASIRATPELSGVRIMVGGIAFSTYPSLVDSVGADGSAMDGASAVALANSWWEERRRLNA